MIGVSVLTGLFFGSAILAFPMLQQLVYPDDTHVAGEESYQKDVAILLGVPPNFKDITNHFVTLSEEKGAVYAFEILKRAELPPNIDIHLLGHAVGDELYKQEGFDGMQYCTPDFRNACSHTIVIGALLENGMSVFDDVNEVCQKAPGGPGAYTMCFHGFGHGVLAFVEYEFPEAIELCSKVGTAEYRNNEYHQCVGGAVMEMFQGIHNVDVWSQKKDLYLDPENPLQLCQADYMPDEAKYFCYTYITPFIFEAAGAVDGNPTPAMYEKAFSYCAAVEEDELRRVCYAGLGKEFVVLAQDRDIRIMDQMTDPQLMKVISWCQLAEADEGTKACLLEVQNSLYWGGENEYQISIRYCSLMPNAQLESACFNSMFNNVQFFEQDDRVREEICMVVSDEFKQMCSTLILSSR